MIRQVPFREISESVVGIDNKMPVIKGARLFIRYLTRIVGFATSSKALGLALLVTRSESMSRTGRYIRYILAINKIRIEYLGALSNNKLHDAVLKKNEWAELALKESMSLVSRRTAKGYLSLLSRHGHHNGEYGGCTSAVARVSEKKFYIYGPNAKAGPSSKYEDYVLIMMKPMDIDVGAYNEAMLFVNSVYYSSAVCKNEKLKSDLITKYREIYVSCREAVLSEPFIRSKFPMGDQLASPMALGRVLYNLMMRYGKFSCVIEGFDFYLDSAMYGTYYPTLNRDKNNMINEQVICSSLADHDALYNFLYVKEIVGKIDIVDSVDFKSTIKLTGERYLDELSRVRTFESLG